MTEEERKYFLSLSNDYPTKTAAASEIVRLSAMLDMPKGTEYFMSDLHGDWEAFSHARNISSGVIQNKVRYLFSKELNEDEQNKLCKIIQSPIRELREISMKEHTQFLKDTLFRLIKILKLTAKKYTPSKIIEYTEEISDGFGDTIRNLIFSDTDNEYIASIVKSTVQLGIAKEFIESLSSAIKKLLISRLHIVGDIFDRGAHPDLIIDALKKERSVDIQWGNHDCLWMGAAAGSEVCIATVINNSITYKNLDLIEIGYGISLRPLEEFADEIYGDSNVNAFLARGDFGGNDISMIDDMRIARMHKAISVIQFKLEGQVIKRNPEFLMDDRLILETLDKKSGTVKIEGKEFKVCDVDFPTLSEEAYNLSEKEYSLMKYLTVAFTRSKRLGEHIRFLYEKGETYSVSNGNLIFHGAIPLDDNGNFLPLPCADGLSGKALMDFCDRRARQGYFAKEGSEMRKGGMDFLWFLWCGKNSPLSGRKKIASFERLLISDKAAHKEDKNGYFRVWDDERIAVKILEEFGLSGNSSHIINGHIPVRQGENPIKASGKVIVIDGGFCAAYHKTTGIGGYTLIYNREGLRLTAHAPISRHTDGDFGILFERTVWEHTPTYIKIRECDEGVEIRDKILDLLRLIHEFEYGNIKEKGLYKL